MWCIVRWLYIQYKKVSIGFLKENTWDRLSFCFPETFVINFHITIICQLLMAVRVTWLLELGVWVGYLGWLLNYRLNIRVWERDATRHQFNSIFHWNAKCIQEIYLRNYFKNNKKNFEQCVICWSRSISHDNQLDIKFYLLFCRKRLEMDFLGIKSIESIL